MALYQLHSCLFRESWYLILGPATGESPRDLKRGFRSNLSTKLAAQQAWDYSRSSTVSSAVKISERTDLCQVYVKGSEDQEGAMACCFGKAADLT